MKEIFVVSQPRSGNAWLTRLLGDALDSPLQSHNTTEEPEYFGNGRGGEYIIRKTHRSLKDRVWSIDTPTILLQRDPRDVVVSRIFYRRQEPTETNIMAVINGLINVKQPYDNWIRLWQQGENVIQTSYEKLHYGKHMELKMLIRNITRTTNFSTDRAEEVYEYQKFGNVEARYGDRFKGSMHKGVSGDWGNHFFKEAGEYITDLVGALMLENGYIDSIDWWKEL